MSVPGSEHRLVEVEVTYVEMLDPSPLRPAPETQLAVVQAEMPSPQLNRFLYTAVGSKWGWVDRLSWTYDFWWNYLDREEMQTWVGYVRGTPAGYFELDQQGSDIEIRSFGLLPQFIGYGYGGDLLSRAVRHAWSLGALRVWLHTCTLDSPVALNNYLARGFQIYRTERVQQSLPMVPCGPWW